MPLEDSPIGRVFLRIRNKFIRKKKTDPVPPSAPHISAPIPILKKSETRFFLTGDQGRNVDKVRPSLLS